MSKRTEDRIEEALWNRTVPEGNARVLLVEALYDLRQLRTENEQFSVILKRDGGIEIARRWNAIREELDKTRIECDELRRQLAQ